MNKFKLLEETKKFFKYYNRIYPITHINHSNFWVCMEDILRATNEKKYRKVK